MCSVLRNDERVTEDPAYSRSWSSVKQPVTLLGSTCFELRATNSVGRCLRRTDIWVEPLHEKRRLCERRIYVYTYIRTYIFSLQCSLHQRAMLFAWKSLRKELGYSVLQDTRDGPIKKFELISDRSSEAYSFQLSNSCLPFVWGRFGLVRERMNRSIIFLFTRTVSSLFFFFPVLFFFFSFP